MINRQLIKVNILQAIERAHGSLSQEKDTQHHDTSEPGEERTETSFDTSSLSSRDYSCDEEDTENLLSDVDHEDAEEENDVPLKTVTSSKRLSYKMRKVLIHGSFFFVGICILVAGGVSSHFHPYVDPEEYYNCTSFGNNTNSSYSILQYCKGSMH